LVSDEAYPVLTQKIFSENPILKPGGHKLKV
jgi:hypothetical protein